MSPETGQQLSHYRLLEKIGEGGMGMVWKAKDTVLGRVVAIKILPPDCAVDEHRRRMFLSEARLASSVQNAHVAQIYELGREGDTDFIVMEYVEGRPLHHALLGVRQPPERIADIGAQIARGLSQAHRQGLLHRDIKPANVLLTADGEVKIVDFGIATLTDPDRADVDSSSLTRTSAVDVALPEPSERPAPVIGTVPYLSPEAVRRGPVDERTDVYSVGVLLYELAAGRRPYVGRNDREIAEQILEADPIAPEKLVPGLEPRLNRIILKAMAGDPEQRYSTMEDLGTDLRELARDLELGTSSPTLVLDAAEPPARRRPARLGGIAAVGVALLLVAGGWLLSRWVGGSTTDPGTLRILPLRVVASAPGPDYLGLAVSEALAVNLARAPSLRVLPVSPPDPVLGDDFRALAREARGMGAGRLLQGRIVREDDTLSASVSLLDTREERVLWGMQAETSESELSGLVARLTDDLAAELGVELPREYDYIGNLTGGPAMAVAPETTSALAGIRRGEIDVALSATERLVERFPDEAAAHALRAQALLLWWDANPSAENRTRLEESMAMAERLDPRAPYVPFWRAYMADWDRDPDALASFDAILARDDLTPAARAWILRWRSNVLGGAGDAERALSDLEESSRLDPTNANPGYWRNHLILGLALQQSGRMDEATGAFRRACELGDAQMACALHAIVLQARGLHEEAREAIDHAVTLIDVPFGTYNIARYWAITGEREKALAAVKHSLELGADPSGFMTDDDFAALHDDQEFRRLVEGG
jgi:tetratricopeptide (TPR) repeat protein/predicted Ser/Thr protein kinase/TolB-like protein